MYRFPTRDTPAGLCYTDAAAQDKSCSRRLVTDVFTNADAHLCECVAADIKRQYEHNSSTRWVTCDPDGLTIPHARP